MQRAGLALVLAAAAALRPASPVSAAENAEAVLVLDVVAVSVPGRVWSAAPPRFALYDDGQVYVGGTSQVAAGRGEEGGGGESGDHPAQVGRPRGGGGGGRSGEGGPRPPRRGRRGNPPALVGPGAPAPAPAAMKTLAALLTTLAAFEHPSLRPYD